VREPEDLGHLAGFIVRRDLGRLPFPPHGDDRKPQQHSVGYAQDRVDEAGHVALCCLRRSVETRRCTSTSPPTAPSIDKQIMKRPKIMLIAEPPSLVLRLIPSQGYPVHRRILLPERLIILMALLLTWVIGIAAVGALIFWSVKRLSGPHA
jgi:hypothetical protein